MERRRTQCGHKSDSCKRVVGSVDEIRCLVLTLGQPRNEITSHRLPEKRRGEGRIGAEESEIKGQSEYRS